MFLKFLKRFFLLIKSEYIIKKPDKAKILIWDYDKLGFNIVNRVVEKKQISILYKRYEQINIFILFKCLIKLKFNPIEYFNEYVKYVNPKILISFVDNYDTFYKIKSENCIKIVVQNALRHGKDTYGKYFFKKDKNLKVDFFFGLGKSILKKYEEKIQLKKTYALGSIRSNENLIKHNPKKTKFLFISSFRKQSVKRNLLELTLLNDLTKYLGEKNEILHILAPKNKINTKTLKDFYKANLKFNNWNLIGNNKKDLNFPYRAVDSSKYVIGIDSTLVYESFSRKNKTIFIDVFKEYYKKNYRFHYIGWPNIWKKKGPYWLHYNFNYQELEDFLNNIFKIKKNYWNFLFKKYSKNFSYNYKNKILLKIIKKNL